MNDMLQMAIPTVFIVDDDEQARFSVCALVRALGKDCQAFASAEDFLQSYDPTRPGCVVTDLRLSGKTGVELQEELLQRGCRIPVIVLTGFARTPLTVRAMRNGAVTMLDKPYREDELAEAIDQALQLDAEQRSKRHRKAEIKQRMQSLTPSENQVLRMIVDGVPNKTIAVRMDVSERTVESRRHEIFAKLQANSVAELVRLVIEAEEAT